MRKAEYWKSSNTSTTDSLQHDVAVRKMCLLCCWTFILASSLLWWPRWSVNRIYRSSSKRVRSHTASVTVTESKCWRKGEGEHLFCGQALNSAWGSLATPLAAAREVCSSAARSFSSLSSDSHLAHNTHFTELVSIRFAPKFSDHLLKIQQQQTNYPRKNLLEERWQLSQVPGQDILKSLSVSQDQYLIQMNSSLIIASVFPV